MADRATHEALMNIGSRYAEVLRRELALRSLYIFGSYATGRYGDDSDIDIAVVSDDLIGFHREQPDSARDYGDRNPHTVAGRS